MISCSAAGRNTLRSADTLQNVSINALISVMGDEFMICGFCGKPMLQGEFRIEMHSTDKGLYKSYSVSAFYQNGTQYCETPLDKTLGFYCPECGAMAGIFRYTKPVNFAGSFNTDLDDKIDVLPRKKCPECDCEMDIDYPRCPECGFEFFGL